MNHSAARSFAVGSGIAALVSGAVVTAAASATGGLGWALAGWSVTAGVGIAGGLWICARLGRPDAGVLVAFGSTMLARLFLAMAGVLATTAVGRGALWPFVGGLVAGFLPLQAYEVAWFYRAGRHES